jgi:hypothetical protein
MSIFTTKLVKKYLRDLSKVKMEPEKTRASVLALHESRKTRTMADTRVSIKKVREALLQEQAFRSTILSSMLDCKRVLNMLWPMREEIVLRVISEGHAMPVSTKTEKREYLVNGLRKRNSVIEDLEEIVEICEYIIEDIDKSAWSLRNTTSTFELSTRPELT